MKLRSLTTALYLCMAAMTVASSASALDLTHCDAHHRHETTLGISKDLLNIFKSQNIVFAYEGALALSNSTTDTVYLTALIARETQHLNDVTSLFVHRLERFGVRPARLATFEALSAQMYALGWEYAGLVRTNAASDVQLAKANEWEAKAIEVGAVLARIARDPSIEQDYANIVIRQTQNIQAFSGVLTDGLITPADQATEAIAAVELDAAIVELGNSISHKTIRGFCNR